MARLGLETEIVDQEVYDNTVERFREAGIRMPTFAQLADPSTIPDSVRARLADVDPDAPDPLNLFRVHWYNAANRREFVDTPGHLVLNKSLTGVDAPIVVLLGERFPMIATHKVLAAYGCLAPRLVTGQYDPTRRKAVWPSTGNYCRGGVAVSRIMQCRGVAILPEGMSQERFDWLAEWSGHAEDIIRTPGTESNVKEIYDECNRLDVDPDNVIFNQFSEFGNHLVHYAATGKAAEDAFEVAAKRHDGLKLRAYVSATGSGGTIAAGDYLKERYGAKIAAVEALECPTLLENGFGEHNIQGIGDKHVPLIHNVMNTDFVVAVSDRSTDALNALFNTDVGHRYLEERQGVSPAVTACLKTMGLSSICNVVAAIKLAKHQGYGPDDAVVTVATDNASMYVTERDKTLDAEFGGLEGFDTVAAGEVFGEHVKGAGTDHMIELTLEDRRRLFNLGYYTCVEQQGVSFHDFVRRRDQGFWVGLRDLLGKWDAMIEEFNRAAGQLDEGE